jgi:hydroxyacylglutathione hydrolase
MPVHVTVIETPPLGDRSYLIHDGVAALVIDPQRDIDRVESAAESAGGVHITHVAETHIHNDYLTGGLMLARQHDAEYLINAADEVAYDRRPIDAGQTIKVGRLSVDVIATPGHTDTHLAYVVRDGVDQAVFSGGSLLFGSVGRTDLLGQHRAAQLAAAQHASVRRLADHADASAALYPTHGFGSFCAAGPGGGTTSTIGHELLHNEALLEPDVDNFVASLLAGFTAYPTYYAHMAAANQGGPGPADLTLPAPLTADDLRDRLDAGEWVVDVRDRTAFASGHLAGTTSFEYGDGGSFTSYLGWVIPYGAGITLVGDRGDVERGIRDLSRIGFDAPDVALGDGPSDVAPGLATKDYPRLDWPATQAARTADDLVIDTPRTDEYATEHVAGAINIPMHDVQTELPGLPRGRRLIVHCASGYRAGVVASMLERAGFDVVHVDDDYENAAPAGVAVTR